MVYRLICTIGGSTWVAKSMRTQHFQLDSTKEDFFSLTNKKEAGVLNDKLLNNPGTLSKLLSDRVIVLPVLLSRTLI